jgi:hypothetical protein
MPTCPHSFLQERIGIDIDIDQNTCGRDVSYELTTDAHCHIMTSDGSHRNMEISSFLPTVQNPKSASPYSTHGVCGTLMHICTRQPEYASVQDRENENRRLVVLVSSYRQLYCTRTLRTITLY